MADSLVVGALRVLLSANAAEFEASMQRAAKSVEQWSKDFAKTGRDLENLGRRLTTTVTLPIAGIGTAAAKSAIDFESSFAGVRKTVDATEAEFAQMAQSFRELSKTIPVNVNELNRLGEAAGALGIPKAEIVDFARVMAELGVTTNLTSDQAAESIAQIQTQFQAAGKETENFASTLVHLGNNGASTEAQILGLASRLASAGNAAGMNQAQVLGFAAAMANVGIEAEAGGTALSRTFNEINVAVAKGGQDLTAFAQVAGMSADEFSKKFKTDAAGAVEAFILGLGRVHSEGGNLITTLEELGIKEIRQSDTLRRLALNTDNVSKALADANVGWSQNSALTDEARKRFETTESQLTLLWNRVKDVGITLGNALLPVINQLIGLLDQAIPLIEAAAKWFADLPKPVQTTAVAVGGLVSALGPLLFVAGQVVSTFAALAPWIVRIGAVIGGILGVVGSFATAVVGLAVAWANFKDDWVRAFDVLIPPLGLFRLAFDKLPAAFAEVKTKIIQYATEIYNGIKTWMVDRFNSIVQSISGMITTVGDKFKWLKDVVVGNSYVPEMIDGISSEFIRLEDVMVKPTMTGATSVADIFRNMSEAVLDTLGGMFGGFGDTVMTFMGGSKGGFLGDLIQTGLGSIFGDGGLVMNLVGKGLAALGDLVLKGLKKIGGFFKDLFGGPSAEELAGREIVHAFERNLSDMLTDAQRLEAGNDSWKKTVIAIRDAYIAQGRSEQEALKDAERLWNSSKDGADASRRVVEEITKKMGEFAGTIAAAFNQFPREINIPVHFAVDQLNLPEIPQLARGGIVTRPTLALIGESGPEAVVPLSRGGGVGDAQVAKRLEALIDRLEHSLPIAIRDAVAQMA